MRKTVLALAITAGLITLFGLGIASAVVTTETTGEVSACATATTPAHTVAVDGGDVHVIPGDSQTNCVTSTYTVPPAPTTTVTSTETVPATTTDPVTTTDPTTTTVPVTTTDPVTTTISSGHDLTVNNQIWICSKPINYDTVTVTITGTSKDAVHLHAGCTGHIGYLHIVQHTSGDGMKIGEGSHDITIDNADFTFDACPCGAHQDGIQAMGGQRVTIKDLVETISNKAINNSGFFVNKGTQSSETPTDITCDGCTIRSTNLSNTAKVNGVRSGLLNSKVCGNFQRSGVGFVDINNIVTHAAC